LGVQQCLGRPWYPHHVAEAGEDDSRFVRKGDAVIDAAHGNDANRTAGTMDKLDVGGQQVVDPILVDRVRVPSAHLHDLVVPIWLDRGQNLAGDHPAQLRITEFVDELQVGIPPTAARVRAVPACTSNTSPELTGSTSAISTLARSPSGSEHRARLRRESTLTTRIGMASSPQVMHPCAATHSFMPGARSLDHTRLDLLELLLVLGAHLLQQSKRRVRLILIYLREREADMDEHPVSRASGRVVHVEQADVHCPPDARDLDRGESVLLVHHFNNLSWDC